MSTLQALLKSQHFLTLVPATYKLPPWLASLRRGFSGIFVGYFSFVACAQKVTIVIPW